MRKPPEMFGLWPYPNPIGQKFAQNDLPKAKHQKIRKQMNLAKWKLLVYMNKPQKHVRVLH